MRSRITFITCIAFLTLTPAGFGTENDRLTREERDRVGHLYAKVMRDKQVTEARRVHAEATKHYHDVLRQAMIKRDPKIRPALGKIQINPALLAEAIWEKRNKDILDNLHLPVRRLGTEERKRWDQAMDNLQKREITKAFSKRLGAMAPKEALIRAGLSVRRRSCMTSTKRMLRIPSLLLTPKNHKYHNKVTRDPDGNTTVAKEGGFSLVSEQI